MKAQQPSNPNTGRTGKIVMAGAVTAALAASACCIVPLGLVSLGVGGAVVASLSVLEPFRPLFIAIAAGALLFAGRREWRSSRRDADCTCKEEAVSPRVRRGLLAAATIVVVGLIASPWLLSASSPAASSPVVAQTSALSTAQVALEVAGMTCASCNVIVRAALLKVEGVEQAEVSFEPPRAVVNFDPARASVDQLVEATAAAGFDVRPVGSP